EYSWKSCAQHSPRQSELARACRPRRQRIRRAGKYRVGARVPLGSPIRSSSRFPMRLLIVEDEDLLRARLVKALSDSGYVVDSASDGKTGLFEATENDYDAAIIDLGLPQLDGIGLIKALREKGRTFPVLILTARDNWTDKVAGLDAGADDYVVKPFQLE